LRPYALALGNPNFFVPRIDYYALASWNNFYDTEPLRQTPPQLVDLKALADPKATPGLLVSATDVEAGQIEYFYSGDKGLSLDHIVASGSLPPSFPMTVINDKFYWDGGIFDNTPLDAALDRLDTSVGADRTI
jgi:NTE family protein